MMSERDQLLIRDDTDKLRHLYTGSGQKDKKDVHTDIIASCDDHHEDDKIDTSELHKAYWSRWYILAVFSMLSIWSSTAWNTWAPISDTAKVVLCWTDGNIALLTSLGFVAVILAAPLASWMIDVQGLRRAVVASTLILVLGLVIRALPAKDNILWTMNVGQFLLNLSNPVFLAGAPALSAVWFPPHERTTSTAIASLAPYLGTGMSFFVGIQVVPNIDMKNMSVLQPSNSSELSPHDNQYYYSKIMELIYIELAVGVALLVIILVYYPDKPPTAPSNTADIPRTNFREGIRELSKNKMFWLIALPFSLNIGFSATWFAVLSLVFQDNIQQSTAGWIGVFSSCAGLVAGILFGRLIDYLKGRMKLILLLLLGGSTIVFAWILCLTNDWIQFSNASLFASCILFGFLMNGTLPIYFEMAVERTYPVAEGITTTVMIVCSQVVGLIFLLIKIIPGIGVQWMNWAVFVSMPVSIPFLLLYREEHHRLDMDQE